MTLSSHLTLILSYDHELEAEQVDGNAPFPRVVLAGSSQEGLCKVKTGDPEDDGS